jgi:hypothetical protein
MGNAMRPAVALARLAVRSVIGDLRIVDPERLRAIPESLRVQWLANRWLAALEAHVASARNWNRLPAYEDDNSATLVRPHLAASL